MCALVRLNSAASPKSKPNHCTRALLTKQGGGPALEAEGVVPRVLRQMLAHAGATDGCRVRISVFEIYQEKLRDLLVPSSSSVGPAKRKSFGSSSSSARGSFLFGGSNGGSGPRASFAPPTNADHNRGSGGVGARDSRDLPIREDARGNIVVPGLREVEVTVSE